MLNLSIQDFNKIIINLNAWTNNIYISFVCVSNNLLVFYIASSCYFGKDKISGQAYTLERIDSGFKLWVNGKLGLI